RPTRTVAPLAACSRHPVQPVIPVDGGEALWYIGTMVTIERVQTGVRIEKRILKVLKAMAAMHEMTLGDLLEGIVLHAFEGKAPFGTESMRRIAELKKVYGLDLGATHSHKLVEAEAPAAKRRGRK